MSNDSNYGELRVETSYHTLEGNGLSLSGRAQKVIDTMDTIISLKESTNPQADAKWFKRRDSIIKDSLNIMKTHLTVMMGKKQQPEMIDEIIKYAKEYAVNNVRYDVLKLLAERNPEAYNRPCAYYAELVNKQRG